VERALILLGAAGDVDGQGRDLQDLETRVAEPIYRSDDDLFVGEEVGGNGGVDLLLCPEHRNPANRVWRGVSANARRNCWRRITRCRGWGRSGPPARGSALLRCHSFCLS